MFTDLSEHKHKVQAEIFEIHVGYMSDNDSLYMTKSCQKS
jgi:hypothetical protein